MNLTLGLALLVLCWLCIGIGVLSRCAADKKHQMSQQSGSECVCLGGGAVVVPGAGGIIDDPWSRNCVCCVLCGGGGVVNITLLQQLRR
ncbi:hypothetical protein BDR07DRAFT_1414485 [Suillus spraguei]|nr:hypothetical protein BDR07DRAFT_1414485 [Suillus spraguei]